MIAYQDQTKGKEMRAGYLTKRLSLCSLIHWLTGIYALPYELNPYKLYVVFFFFLGRCGRNLPSIQFFATVKIWTHSLPLTNSFSNHLSFYKYGVTWDEPQPPMEKQIPLTPSHISSLFGYPLLQFYVPPEHGLPNSFLSLRRSCFCCYYYTL